MAVVVGGAGAATAGFAVGGGGAVGGSEGVGVGVLGGDGDREGGGAAAAVRRKWRYPGHPIAASFPETASALAFEAYGPTRSLVRGRPYFGVNVSVSTGNPALARRAEDSSSAERSANAATWTYQSARSIRPCAPRMTTATATANPSLPLGVIG